MRSVVPEAQACGMEASARLARVVADEFGDILTVVLSNLESVMEAVGDAHPELSREVEDVRRISREGARRIEELAILAGRGVFSPQRLDLAALVREARPTLEAILPSDVRLWIAPRDASPTTIHSDRFAVNQILLDVVSNAGAAMPDGGEVRVEVRSAEAGAGGTDRRVGLVISDTGLGMDPGTCERIFDPFFTTSKDGASRGLGLSIAHAFVRSQGGSISVGSRPGLGTTVEAWFPGASTGGLPTPRGVGPVAAPRPCRSPSPSPSERPAPKSSPRETTDRTILIVENEPAIRRSIRKGLDRYGYESICACSGEEALELLGRRGGGVALVVADLEGSSIQAEELVDTARAHAPDARFIFTRGCPVGVLGRDGRSTRELAVLPKPWAASELVARIRWMLSPHSIDGRPATPKPSPHDAP